MTGQAKIRIKLRTR